MTLRAGTLADYLIVLVSAAAVLLYALTCTVAR